jgi:heme A synthase
MSVPRRGGEDGLRGFRLLSEITAAATFLLIILGGVVRVSESGLGCGPAGSSPEGWPLCGGDVIPLVGDAGTLVEFSHRLLAAIVVALIALLAWRAYRGLRHLGWPLRGSLLAGALVLLQAGLGGLTVERNLDEELVAAHLGLAMLLLGLLLWLVVRARAGERLASSPHPVPGLKPLATVAATLLMAAIVAGGYVAGTEKEGAEGPAVVNAAHLACGKEFPTCLDGRLLPFGESRFTDIHLTHRVLVYAAAAAIALLIGLALRRGSRSVLLAAAAALLLAQLLLGALNVWLGEHAALVVAHLTIATLLWGTVVVIVCRLAWAPAAAARPATTAGAETSTATA